MERSNLCYKTTNFMCNFNATKNEEIKQNCEKTYMFRPNNLYENTASFVYQAIISWIRNGAPRSPP